MNRRLFILIVSCILMLGLHAETVRVLRFVPVAGAESEVTQDSLRKVVFTQDSVVLISAKDGEATPMYKYDYRSILFAESSSPERVVTVDGEGRKAKGEKFIKDGQLLIRIDGQVYDAQGRRVN